jgi:uncharacterized protein
MRNTSPTQHSRIAIRGLCLALLAMGGCSSTPTPEPKPIEPEVVEQQPVAPQKPTLTLPPSAYQQQFSDAERLLGQFRWMAASEVLAGIPAEHSAADGLTADDSVYLGYLQARIAYIRGQQQLALEQLALVEYPGMNSALQYRIMNFRRHMAGTSGDHLEAARLGDQLLRMAPPDTIPALKRGIWRDLQQLDSQQLQTAIVQAQDSQWQAWLELAVASRSDSSANSRGLSNWQLTHSGHPAAAPLPGGLGYLLEGVPQSSRIALLLPLSGSLAPAGKAVRDGYLASYYAARAAGASTGEILILDVDAYASPTNAYDEAVAGGARLVVGPLSKQAVAEIARRTDRSVPVLSLNRSDEPQAPMEGSQALVQLALAPEDEAGSLAQLAYGRGARSALIIRPADDWGSKMAQALLESWGRLGGTIANSVTYSSREDYSDSVKAALDISASEQRARAVRDMLASNIEFTARRRQDIDAIFLLARNGAQARALKPLLAFHYAGKLPIYSTSSIYNGIPDPRDRDLDGINFVEIPWLLGSSPELRVAIAAGDTGSDSYTRLNALGADAFLLQSRFRQLQAGPDALVRGHTGLLSMDPRLQIRRDLPLATFDGGEIKRQ